MLTEASHAYPLLLPGTGVSRDTASQNQAARAGEGDGLAAYGITTFLGRQVADPAAQFAYVAVPLHQTISSTSPI